MFGYVGCISQLACFVTVYLVKPRGKKKTHKRYAPRRKFSLSLRGGVPCVAVTAAYVASSVEPADVGPARAAAAALGGDTPNQRTQHNILSSRRRLY